MPWTPKQFKERHNHGLTHNQARAAAKAANAALAAGKSEASAIAIGNAVARDMIKRGKR